MKNVFIKKTIAAALTSAALLGVLPMAASAAAKTGWVPDAGKWYYYDNNGVMEKNTTVTDCGKEYKLGADGAWIEGNAASSGTATKANTEGQWKKEDYAWHFYNKDGVMLKNTIVNYNGREYSLSSDGTWVENPNIHSTKGSNDTKGTFDLRGGSWKFYNEAGVMLKNTTVTLGGESYQLGADGAWIKEQGYLTVGTASSNSDERAGLWVLNGDKWYYRYNSDNSYAKKKWEKVKGQWFYFDEQGAMEQNTTLTIDGKEYTFGGSGACTNC